MLFNTHTHFDFHEGVAIQNCDDLEIPNSYFSIGNHPWHSESLLFQLDEIKVIGKLEKCLAIGEIGLDKLKNKNLSKQTSLFIQQIEVAEELKLPVILHCVKSWNEIEKIKQQLKPKQKWIFHGFNKESILNQVVKNELMISIGHSILTNEKLQHSLKNIPNNQLLIETDDKMVDILDIYKKVSDLKNISLSDLEKIIEQNFTNTFTKWQIG